MNLLEKRGGEPQNSDRHAGEVVATRAESDFSRLAYAAAKDDPFDAPSPTDIDRAAREACLVSRQKQFLITWIIYKGDLISIAEEGGYSPSDIVRYLSYPSSIRILSEVSNLHAEIPPPIPSKEELAAVWGFVSRDNSFPTPYQKEARQELSKLMGYYTTPSDGTVNVGVQVVLKGDLC